MHNHTLYSTKPASINTRYIKHMHNHIKPCSEPCIKTRLDMHNIGFRRVISEPKTDLSVNKVLNVEHLSVKSEQKNIMSTE